MRKLNSILIKFWFVFFAICLVAFMTLQTKFLIKNEYDSNFIDYLAYPIWTALILSIVTLIICFKLFRHKIIIVLTVLVSIFTLSNSIYVSSRLDKTKCLNYRQDLGLGAIYIYLDTIDCDYILEHTGPYKKETYLGLYKSDSSFIILDKKINCGFGETDKIDKRLLTRLK